MKQNKYVESKIRAGLKDLDYHFKRDGWKLDYGFIKQDILESIFGPGFAAVCTRIWEAVDSKYPIDFTGFESRPFIFKNKKERDNAIQDRSTEERILGTKPKKPKATRTHRRTRKVRKAKLRKRTRNNRSVSHTGRVR